MLLGKDVFARNELREFYNPRSSSRCQVDGGTSQDVSEVSDAMVKNFHSSVEMLLERMQKVSGQGKHIAMDATVQVC